MTKLTQKQEAFCLKYFELGNATEAAIVAGYNPKFATTHTTRWLNMASIRARLAELNQKAENESVMSVLERKQRLSEIARARLTDFQTAGADGSWIDIGPENEHSGALQEITGRTEYDKDSSSSAVITKVKLHSPILAIGELNKMEKIYTDGAIVNVDNRSIEIIVSSDVAKKLTEQIIQGDNT